MKVRDPRGVEFPFLYNVRSYGLSVIEMSRVEAAVKSRFEIFNGNRVDCSLILAGDFDLHPEDEAKVEVDCPRIPGAFLPCWDPGLHVEAVD